MKKPFGFVQAYYQQEKVLKVSLSADPNKRLEQVKEKAIALEKNVEHKFDEVSQKVAEKLGMREIPWFKWTYNLTIVYSIVTCFVMFHRPDFFNVST